MLSFKEVKEKFSDRRFSPEITQEMMQNGKTTEALQEQFGNTDWQVKFNKFVEECKQMELSKSLFGNREQDPLAAEQGVVVMTEINYPKYVYLKDIVVPSKNNRKEVVMTSDFLYDGHVINLG